MAVSEVSVSFKKGSQFKQKDAESTIAVLMNIYRDSGKLTAEQIVREAEAKDSPLHDKFEWDDSEAAKQYRLEQARLLVRSVVIYHPDSGVQRRIFVNVVSEQQSQYVPLEVAMKNSTLRDQVLQDAKRDAEGFIEKYEDLKEFSVSINYLKEEIKEIA